MKKIIISIMFLLSTLSVAPLSARPPVGFIQREYLIQSLCWEERRKQIWVWIDEPIIRLEFYNGEKFKGYPYLSKAYLVRNEDGKGDIYVVYYEDIKAGRIYGQYLDMGNDKQCEFWGWLQQ